MYVLIVICVGSVRWDNLAARFWLAQGIPLQEVPNDQIPMPGHSTSDRRPIIEGPGMVLYLGKKHTIDVLIVICVVSVRKAPALRFT